MQGKWRHAVRLEGMRKTAEKPCFKNSGAGT